MCILTLVDCVDLKARIRSRIPINSLAISLVCDKSSDVCSSVDVGGRFVREVVVITVADAGG